LIIDLSFIIQIQHMIAVVFAALARSRRGIEVDKNPSVVADSVPRLIDQGATADPKVAGAGPFIALIKIFDLPLVAGADREGRASVRHLRLSRDRVEPQDRDRHGKHAQEAIVRHDTSPWFGGQLPFDRARYAKPAASGRTDGIIYRGVQSERRPKRKWRPVEERFKASPGAGMASPADGDASGGVIVPFRRSEAA
jgi:hypothetical protein